MTRILTAGKQFPHQMWIMIENSKVKWTSGILTCPKHLCVNQKYIGYCRLILYEDTILSVWYKTKFGSQSFGYQVW